jgi:hypothetical protein
MGVLVGSLPMRLACNFAQPYQAADHSFGSKNVESFDQSALLASRMITTLRPEVEKKVSDLTRRFPALSSAELRIRLWIVESIVLMVAGENSTADPSRLDTFFAAYWSAISRQLKSELPGRDFRQEFDAGLDHLAAEIDSDRERLAPEKAPTALGNRIAAFLELPEGGSPEYGYKLAMSTKLLNQLPE